VIDAAIVGLGWWGKVLVQSRSGSSKVRIVRGVTPRPEAAREFTQSHGFPVTSHYAEALARHLAASEVAAVSEQLRKAGINATEAKVYAEYAPDYAATFFEDPDGIRLEVTAIGKSVATGMTIGISKRANPWVQGSAEQLRCSVYPSRCARPRSNVTRMKRWVSSSPR
jgi:hypothetical protein